MKKMTKKEGGRIWKLRPEDRKISKHKVRKAVQKMMNKKVGCRDDIPEELSKY